MDKKDSFLQLSSRVMALLHQLPFRLDGLMMFASVIYWITIAAGSLVNGESFLLIIPIIYGLTTIFIYIVCHRPKGRGIIGASLMTGLNVPIAQHYPC